MDETNESMLFWLALNKREKRLLTLKLRGYYYREIVRKKMMKYPQRANEGLKRKAKKYFNV